MNKRTKIKIIVRKCSQKITKNPVGRPLGSPLGKAIKNCENIKRKNMAM